MDAVLGILRMVLVVARATAIAPPSLPPELGLEHALAAIAAESEEVSAEEILRIANHESGYWLDARPGMRHWPHDPRRFPRRRTYVCGLMQVAVKTPRACVAMMSPRAGYAAGAAVMRRWHQSCRSWGRRGARRYRCARAGYAHGSLPALDA